MGKCKGGCVCLTMGCGKSLQRGLYLQRDGTVEDTEKKVDSCSEVVAGTHQTFKAFLRNVGPKNRILS